MLHLLTSSNIPLLTWAQLKDKNAVLDHKIQLAHSHGFERQGQDGMAMHRSMHALCDR